MQEDSHGGGLTKSVNVQRGVNERRLNVEKTAELEEAAPEGEDVDREGITKIDEHVRALVLAALDVEANCHHVKRLAALHEITLHRKSEKPVGALDVMILEP